MEKLEDPEIYELGGVGWRLPAESFVDAWLIEKLSGATLFLGSKDAGDAGYEGQRYAITLTQFALQGDPLVSFVVALRSPEYLYSTTKELVRMIVCDEIDPSATREQWDDALSRALLRGGFNYGKQFMQAGKER